jgi:glucosamine-6-phosphate deaminase
MQTIVAESYEQLSQRGADIVARTLAARPSAALLVATGNTPMGVYQELARRRRQGELDTGEVRVFQLDEYVGLGADDFRSLYGWTRRSFVEPLGIPDAHVTRLEADAADPQRACEAYESAVVAAGGIDLAILGLGPNGHLGFNEPPSEADAPTRIIELAEASVASNAQYWGGRDQVPRKAVTAGMNVILAARHIVLVVSGTHKRDILERTISGALTPDVPASWLQRAPNVTILADRDALPVSPS